MEGNMPHIVVVGSLNMDLVVEVPVIPQPGETVLGNNFATYPGGKGANQAVAAARLGADVSLIGRVGDDAFGEQLLANARAEGVDVSHVGIDENAASGVAMISVDAKGQNSIAVASGANFELTAEHVAEAWSSLSAVDMVVMPLETPPETIATAAKLAKDSGVRVVLNPAPARPLDDELLARIDVLIPNEHEAGHLSGLSVTSAEEATLAGQHLIERGVGNVVITLGGLGALILTGASGDANVSHIRPHQVEVLDTTAAGDSFVAGLAVALGEGNSLEDAAAFANAAGAITVTRIGAQPALATRDEVKRLLQHNSEQS
jgi:ribokinase